MIIIENPQNFRDEELLLERLGFKGFVYQEDTTLDECMYPQDKSVNIGYYNGNIIMCINMLIIENLLKDLFVMSDFEKNITMLFPHSEIIIICCHSVINFHAYIIIKNGERIRIKSISADNKLTEHGELLEEEQEIYNKAIIKDEERIWVFPDMLDEEFKEDQLMEEFTFSVIKRRLGIYISETENEELINNTAFRKYRKESIWKKIRKWF